MGKPKKRVFEEHMLLRKRTCKKRFRMYNTVSCSVCSKQYHERSVYKVDVLRT